MTSHTTHTLDINDIREKLNNTNLHGSPVVLGGACASEKLRYPSSDPLGEIVERYNNLGRKFDVKAIKKA